MIKAKLTWLSAALCVPLPSGARRFEDSGLYTLVGIWHRKVRNRVMVLVRKNWHQVEKFSAAWTWIRRYPCHPFGQYDQWSFAVRADFEAFLAGLLKRLDGNLKSLTKTYQYRLQSARLVEHLPSVIVEWLRTFSAKFLSASDSDFAAFHPNRPSGRSPCLQDKRDNTRFVHWWFRSGNPHQGRHTLYFYSMLVLATDRLTKVSNNSDTKINRPLSWTAMFSWKSLVLCCWM